MLKRKITTELLKWKEKENKLPLIINGQRQVGKTTSVLEFAKKYYDVIYELNFFEHPEFASIFSSSLDSDTVLNKLSLAFPSIHRSNGSMLIFLDEIQHCPNGRTALKFLANDPRFDVIASGSLLELNHSAEQSFPVGYVQHIELNPLDFEEFLWAMEVGDDIVGYLRECYEEKKAVDSFVHNTILSYFVNYMIIGGMPAVVDNYVKTNDYSIALSIQKDIIKGYKNDVVKYAEDKEKAKILRTLDSVPVQLAKNYKKFQYSLIDKSARFRSYGGSLLWLKDAGIVSFCNNISSLQFPLVGFSVDDEFKVYLNDTGLLVSMYEEGTAFRLQNGELGLFKGALYENIIAQSLRAQDIPLYYFSPSSSLEIDFVIIYEDEVCPVEVKSGENKKSKSLTTVLNTEKYNIKRAIRFSRNNVGFKDGIVSLPLYMVMFLKNNEKKELLSLPNADELRKHIKQ